MLCNPGNQDAAGHCRAIRCLLESYADRQCPRGVRTPGSSKPRLPEHHLYWQRFISYLSIPSPRLPEVHATSVRPDVVRQQLRQSSRLRFYVQEFSRRVTTDTYLYELWDKIFNHYGDEIEKRGREIFAPGSDNPVLEAHKKIRWKFTNLK